MALAQKKLPEIALRLGFGFLFLYSGLDLVRHPSGWYWALRQLPPIIQNSINATVGIEQYLRMQGVVELTFAAVFFAWFVPKWVVKIAALLAALEMAAILLLVGATGDTFRDIGLLGGALALFFINTAPSGIPDGLSRK